MTPADTTTFDSFKGCPTGLSPSEIDENHASASPDAFVVQSNGIFTLDLVVRGAKCGVCLTKIESGIRKLSEDIQDVRLNLTTGRLRVSWLGESFSADLIIRQLNQLGYGAAPFDPETVDEAHAKKERQLLTAMAVAGFAAANIMLLSVSVWAGDGEMDSSTRSMMHWVSAAIALPAVAFAGRPFFSSALEALKNGHVNMDVPISLAVTLAMGMSLYETVNNGHHAYFDAAAMLLFFLLIGRFLDAKLQREAHSAARDLANMQAVSVTQLAPDGTSTSVQARSLKPGDTIMIAPGERFPVDAKIIEGRSELDTRLVTGETRLTLIGVCDQVYAGAVNISSAVKALVINPANESMLAEISKLLEVGEQKRSSYRQIADKAAKLYVPIVHTLAAASFMAWMLFTGDVKHSLFISIAVLIITCPCALALAAPVVQVVSVGRLFRHGVYLKSGDALERLAACDVAVFDKTGTLTKSRPKLKTTNFDPEQLENAAQLARTSRHPLSRAIVDIAGGGRVATDVQEQPGKGITGLVGSGRAWLGSPRWITKETGASCRQNASLVFVVEGQQPCEFDFEEALAPGTKELFGRLSNRDVHSIVLSGDHQDRVDELANRIGAKDALGSVSPTEKAEYVDRLTNAGHRVLMIGDGVNDAGAIANAHASLTPGGAIDISRSASDGVFSGDDISVVPHILDIAHASKRRTLENFGFAAIYNCIAVPIAVLGYVTPLVAAIAMSGSSLIVTLNALRINFQDVKD